MSGNNGNNLFSGKFVEKDQQQNDEDVFKMLAQVILGSITHGKMSIHYFKCYFRNNFIAFCCC